MQNGHTPLSLVRRLIDNAPTEASPTDEKTTGGNFYLWAGYHPFITVDLLNSVPPGYSRKVMMLGAISHNNDPAVVSHCIKTLAEEFSPTDYDLLQWMDFECIKFSSWTLKFLNYERFGGITNPLYPKTELEYIINHKETAKESAILAKKISICRRLSGLWDTEDYVSDDEFLRGRQIPERCVAQLITNASSKKQCAALLDGLLKEGVSLANNRCLSVTPIIAPVMPVIGQNKNPNSYGSVRWRRWNYYEEIRNDLDYLGIPYETVTKQNKRKVRATFYKIKSGSWNNRVVEVF